jgi:glycosyltransferase involved in cell wall biosynthesis
MLIKLLFKNNYCLYLNIKNKLWCAGSGQCMNILLINNTSGVHSALKIGLEKLGHNVKVLLAYPNTYQQRQADHFPGYIDDSIPKKIINRLLFFKKYIECAKDADIVNYIAGMSGFSFKGHFPQYRDLPIVSKRGTKLSYYGLGCDELSSPIIRKEEFKLLCQSCRNYNDKLGENCKTYFIPSRKAALKYTKYFSYCASSAWEYKHCSDTFNSESTKFSKIQFPINSDAIEFCPTTQKTKPLIIHSPTRKGFKGTDVVLQAIKILTDISTIEFDFQLVEGLTYSDYLKVMQKCDIYIDQVYSYGVGVAALEMLAMGKVVFSGNSSESKSYFSFSKNSPVINASHDPLKLAIKLNDVLGKHSEFKNLGIRGREYVEKYHDPVIVAQMFLDLWNNK